ncbi:hypothetical protein ABB37_02675 [Leptomonas pyrrhocoris]|uniref:GPI inositol-deacylase n=1 Tax=Leptomonas pyrrhocoris TaxID=157538 RepID=A0A0N0VGE9_LEPPY|nr:hypothetical protein ABB37_02675 [Leptomonas pyrrhocoris]KPA82924.1 hypothetical protein ABB37_02675 [Leptomonas pyrrhocoris]|eukprot:XP_015661363.1 hypothetical protein ABB37_02675 [Leptomonas pyrrhocoris]
MPRTTLYRYAGHQGVRRLLALLFQCICAVTLFSTACYIVDIRSRYRPPRKDFDALTQYSELLWNASGLPVPAVATSELHLPAFQVRDGPFLKNLNASLTRTGGSTDAALTNYNLQKTECLWSALFGPVATTSAAPAPFMTPLVHLHIFFLHGNAGSHTQGEYWTCAVQHASNLLGASITTYALQWAEQANVHRGRLVGLQADYTADVVEAAVRGAVDDDGVRHRVWLVAHSMGGVVARLAAQLLDPSVDLGGIVTFNSPHLFPPLLLDAPMADVYRALTVAEQPSSAGELKHAEKAATPAAAVSGAASPVRLSSATVVKACSTLTDDCLRHRHRQSRVPHLISITSGEMDLQIEPATVYPSRWSSRYAVAFFNTLDRAVCTHTTSHDGILMDPCAVTLGALQLLSASFIQANDTAMPAEAEEVDAANANARAQLPLPPGIVSRVSLVGQLLWQQHMWPWAVSSLYGYVLLGGLWPQVGQSAEMLLQWWPMKRGTVRPLASLLHRIVSSEFSVPVFLVFFYGCTSVYATLTELYLLGTSQRASYGATYPWQWETYPQLRHTSASVVAPLQFVVLTLFFVLTSVGPVTVGINAGMALVVMGSVARYIKARVGRCRRVFATPRRRQTAAVLLPVLLVSLYLVFLSMGVSPTARAMAWVALFLFVPDFRRTQAKQEDRRVTPAAAEDVESPNYDADAVEVHFRADFVVTKVPAEAGDWHTQRLPGMLYAALYLIQLHPFFTVRNALVSHTFDSASTVDVRIFVVEGELLVLLCCCAAAAPVLPVGRYRVVNCYLGFSSSLLSLIAVAWMVVHPVESFQVLPALLWCILRLLVRALFA